MNLLFRTVNIARIAKIVLLGAAYVFIVMMMSRFIDADLGWHLRFGREWWQNNFFPYQDTYTWTNYGKLWVNHEWGGDILFWFIYQYFGFVGLVLIMAGALLSAFLLVIKIFQKKITVSSLIAVIILLWFAQHVIVMRLAMLAPLFLALLWYSLERFPSKRFYYFWPIFFWLWSVLHGSWILGFIFIAIYVAGQVANLLFKKYIPQLYQPSGWGAKEIFTVLFWTALSAVIIILNPYGFGIWREVVEYFFTTYDKLNIADWLPSYAYPVNWEWLVLMGASIPWVGFAVKNKKITWPQLLLFMAFWCSAFRYKRNAIFFAMLIVPLMSLVVSKLQIIWYRLLRSKWYFYILFIICFLAFIFHGVNSVLPTNPWDNQQLMRQTSYPLAGVNFLKKYTAGQPTRIFNDLNWGGYLNWSLPNITLFLDGRGVSTWYVAGQRITYLQYYHQLINEPGGLEMLTKNKVQYVFLPKPRTNYPTDLVNRWMFGAKLEDLINSRTPRLEEDLRKNAKWQIIYEDEVCYIWENKKDSF